MAGGRWQVLALRWTTWLVLVIIALTGLKNIVMPSGTDVNAVARQIGAQYGFNGFPLQAGQALAQRFAAVYLNVTPSPKNALERRQAQLASFLPGGKDQPEWTSLTGYGKDSGVSSQRVISGPYLVGSPILDDASHATFTFASEVVSTENPDASTIYLAVTVYNDTKANADTGQPALTISGPPAIVPAPKQATDSGAFITTTTDRGELKDSLALFFTAWSTKTAIDTFLPDPPAAAKPSVTNGCSGCGVTLEAVNSYLLAPGPKPGEKQINAYVTWKRNGMSWTQSYYLEILPDPAGKSFKVLDIVGGAYGALNPE